MRSRLPIVYIVDDDISVRRSLARLLKANGFSCLCSASCENFLALDHPDRTSCLVLDVQLPGINGLALPDKMAGRGLAMPVIFITGHGTVPMSVKAMKAGAVDFLTKPFTGEQLLAAVRHALQKDSRSRRKQRDTRKCIRLLDTLTSREYEVMRWVIAGRLNKQIARALGTAEKTIKVHRGRIMDKVKVNSVAALVRLTQKAGITPVVKD